MVTNCNHIVTTPSQDTTHDVSVNPLYERYLLHIIILTDIYFFSSIKHIEYYLLSFEQLTNF